MPKNRVQITKGVSCRLSSQVSANARAEKFLSDFSASLQRYFNVEANLTRDQHGEAFAGIILEGPISWTVRPVGEIFYDKVWTQTETRSLLVGAIWQVEHDLSLDAAFRYATVNGHAVNEIRAGLTFAFKEGGDTTPMRPGVTFSNWGLSR